METAVPPGRRRGALAEDVGGRRPVRGGRGRSARHVRHLPSRRRTSPASCTWATRSSSRWRTRSSAGVGCRATTCSSSRATTTRASRRRASSRRSSRRNGLSRHDLGRDGVRGARLGVAAALRRHDHEPVPAHGRVDGLLAASGSRWTTTTSGRCSGSSSISGTRAISTGTTASSTGARSTRARSPISSSTTSKWTTSSSSSATRSPTARGHVTIATVRPATILADVAVAVHPDDERYRDLVGKEAIVPFVERRVPVIADERVEPEFGTGALKVTPGPRPGGLRDRTRPRPARADGDRRRRAHERRGPASSRA